MMIRHARVVLAIGILLSATAAGSGAIADDSSTQGHSSLQVRLSGYEEDPQALSTTGTGSFRARISESRQEISFRLSYAGLEGNITQAHIHFGGKAQSGGISVFLCSNVGSPVPTQACPAAPGTVSGVLRPTDVIGPAGQGIAAGEFAELVAAIRNGTTYVNVHSSKYPAGEIRGQLGHHH
jgi:hypothetical protein